MKDDMKSWRATGMGISLSDHQTDCPSNLRFADDVLLFSTSLEHLKRMMSDFKRSTDRVKIHPDEEINNQRSYRQTEATIDNIKVEVLPIGEKAKYLKQTTSNTRRQK